MPPTYNLPRLREAYARLGVKRGSVVILKTDLRLMGQYEPTSGEDAVQAHYQALTDLIDLRAGTLVVSSACTGLCNTETVFDLAHTPSQMGVLTEYIRTREGAVRSFHPFLSYSAVGKYAAGICLDVSRHGFGPETPEARLLEHDTLLISIGQHPRLTASVLHHAEMLMGVPYRYVKEFVHPVLRNGEVVKEPFYMHVWYRACGNNHDGVQKIFEFYRAGGGVLREEPVGRGMMYSIPLKPYFESNLKALKKDIYMFLKNPPAEKPYRV